MVNSLRGDGQNAVLKRLLKRLPKSSRAPVEVQELEHVDTLEDAAALVQVDTATGEIMGDTAPVEQPKPSANGGRKAKPKPASEPVAASNDTAPNDDDDEAPF